MLGQRRSRWPNIKTSLFRRVVFAGVLHADKAGTVTDTTNIYPPFPQRWPGSLRQIKIQITTKLCADWMRSRALAQPWTGGPGRQNICLGLYGIVNVPFLLTQNRFRRPLSSALTPRIVPSLRGGGDRLQRWANLLYVCHVRTNVGLMTQLAAVILHNLLPGGHHSEREDGHSHNGVSVT